MLNVDPHRQRRHRLNDTVIGHLTRLASSGESVPAGPRNPVPMTIAHPSSAMRSSTCRAPEGWDGMIEPIGDGIVRCGRRCIWIELGHGIALG